MGHYWVDLINWLGSDPIFLLNKRNKSCYDYNEFIIPSTWIQPKKDEELLHNWKSDLNLPWWSTTTGNKCIEDELSTRIC